jgi:hypothetical protein
MLVHDIAHVNRFPIRPEKFSCELFLIPHDGINFLHIVVHIRSNLGRTTSDNNFGARELAVCPPNGLPSLSFSLCSDSAGIHYDNILIAKKLRVAANNGGFVVVEAAAKSYYPRVGL